MTLKEKKLIEKFLKYSQKLKKEWGDISEIEIRLSNVQKDYRLTYLNHALTEYEKISDNDLIILEKLKKIKSSGKFSKELDNFWERLNKITRLYNQQELGSPTPGQITIVHAYNLPDPTNSLFFELGIPDNYYNDFWDFLDELVEAEIIKFENNIKIGGRIIILNSKSPKIEIFQIYEKIINQFSINVRNHWQIFSKWFVYYKDDELTKISSDRLRKDYLAYKKIDKIKK
jgi:hypothetical protein